MNLACMKMVDDRAAVAKIQTSTPVDTKWVDTDKAFEGESRCQSVHELLPENSEVEDRPYLHAGTPPLEALKAIISIAASHSPEVSPMHVDVSRAHFHAKAQTENCSGKDVGKIGPPKKGMYGARGRGKQLGKEIGKGILKVVVMSWGRRFRKSVSQQEKDNLRFDTRGRLCGDRNEGRSVGAQEAVGECVSNQSAESENMLGRDRNIVSARHPTR